jgi:prenyltransferase beta subunit
MLSAMAWLTVPASMAIAQEGEPRESIDSREFMTPETQDAINRGLEWLASRQLENGSFGTLVENYRGNPGVAGLCGMAFLSAGSTPGRGPYGEAIDQTIEFVMSCSTPTGFIVSSEAEGRDPMYGHGFATLFLAEVYGMTEREDVRDALTLAVELIVDTQNAEGGWRYFPRPDDADVSVTVCELMALRAARNAGIYVPKETIDRGVEYLRQNQNEDGGFRYQLVRPQESEFPRSAAAITALYTSGIHEGEIIDDGLAYVLRYLPGDENRRSSQYFYYAHYYAAQATWFAGEDYWNQWYPAARDELLAEQLEDGSWPDVTVGKEYAAAMSLIVLQVPNGYLPILQR